VKDDAIKTDLRTQLEAGERRATFDDVIERDFGQYRKIILPNMTPHPRQKRKPVQ
jgi:hypothetical protein